MTQPPRPAAEQACHECAAPLAADQRWCVVCGARQTGARTDALALLFAERRAAEAAALLAASAGDGAGAGGAAGGEAAAAAVAGPGAASAASAAAASPGVDAARRRRAAVPAALAALVGLFVVSNTSIAALAGGSQQPFTVVLPPQVAQQVAQAPPAEAPVDAAPLDEAPVDEATVLPDETPAAETPATETPAGGDETPAADPGETTTEESSPIQHVFMIVLGSTDVAALAQDETAAPYLAGTLAKSGTLLSGYTTVSGGGLANRIALVSGQGPTRQTLADCTTYGDVSPAEALDTGQTGGDGCVYGFETGHVGDQLRALEKSWKAYTEPAAGAAGAGCRPDASTTRRNPFLWFRGTFEADDCDERNVPLSQLAQDLRATETTPALAWIASDAQQGSAEADAFLERVVPQIQNSLAYADGGLIVITADQPAAASAAPAPAAPTPPAPATPTTPAPAAPPPADPPPATTPTTPVAPPTATTPADPPASTTPTTTTPTVPATPPTGTTPTTTTTPTPVPLARAAAEATAPAAQLAPGPTRYPNVGGALANGGGQRVGALLISPFTPSGRVDATPANAFTLLRTIEQIFGADPLGYAGDADVRPLPEELFSVTP